MKLDEEMNSWALGAEHRVDQNHSGDANKKVCLECLGHGGWNLHDGEESRKTCPACNGTGKAEVVKETEDLVLKAIDAAKWDEIESPDDDHDPLFAHAINGANIQIEDIRTAYLETIARRGEEHKKQVDSLFRDIRSLEKESWERGESLSCAKEHLNNAEKRIAELESELLDINHVCVSHFPNGTGEQLHVALEKGITELEAQLKPRDGGEFERRISKLQYMPASAKCILRVAHAADRAADREEIERLKSTVKNLKDQLFGYDPRELDIVKLKADKAELVDALSILKTGWTAETFKSAMQTLAKHTEVNDGRL